MRVIKSKYEIRGEVIGEKKHNVSVSKFLTYIIVVQMNLENASRLPAKKYFPFPKNPKFIQLQIDISCRVPYNNTIRLMVIVLSTCLKTYRSLNYS